MENKLDHEEWQKENSLTSPEDRDRVNKWRPEQVPSLTESQSIEAVKELRSDVKAVTTDVQRMEVEMPTHYVRKDDMEARFDRIEALLDKLYEKLDNKADK